MTPLLTRNFATRSFRRCLLLATIAGAMAATAFAEPPSVAAKRISTAVNFDGKLDDPAWKDAPVITLTQQSPRPGAETPYLTDTQPRRR